MDQEPLSDIQKLIRLKRFETPPTEAVDDFLVEFQRRQRSQALTGSSTKLFIERVSTYMSSFGRQKWVYAAAGAYVCLMLFPLVKPSTSPVNQQPAGGGTANPVGVRGSVIIDQPRYDPKQNQIRQLPTKVPEVIVF
ncbi:MAG: hypothetical protein ACR2RV_12280 [Verrucomicrobiales bacterium]